MTNPAQPYHYTDAQVSVWLRGLLTIAWADGHFDPEEQDLITQLTQDDLAPATDLGDLKPISAAELAQTLGDDPTTAENFMRTAVMMALANGVYSVEESKVVNGFLAALGLEVDALKSLEHTLYDPEKHDLQADDAFVDEALTEEIIKAKTPKSGHPPKPAIDPLHPVRDWLDGMDMHDPRVARFICKMVPPQCPFERDVVLFGHKIVHIPPMCKINPLYEQLMGLRFRALSYLADDQGEDITPYI
ncbi:Mo-dependent nitrogenase C-terminal domain-containing protein [Spirulina major CS-329]|uniref:Mo-dependent nitrogenase C-terminal domain-containing protein n=1 Tax=Spirulina TaxID=1154 RepID=UPI00232DE0FB|nr:MULTISPECIES: Mo-dependent nitrogenase C-terminal domain-containing protein [Spirulina]MDB9496536.1 Mo-dependent nitrogenase C-terminal domain-containing protein [Spirulina subsalsa CS-330]MDB9505079.1 Mo-dependent nitrogenase C-terminal domain-containing protein [Spirulina major CS-329]